MAGGVALNCAANKLIMNLDFIDEFYVQPAAGDNGISLGAALWGAHELGDTIQPMENAYLGTSWTHDSIKQILDLTGMPYQVCEHPEELAAQWVLEDRVVGWFQGRMEFGPRALGNRSILGNPAHPEMKSIINSKIKFREGYRPFCPSVLAEDHVDYFAGKSSSAPYMTINFDVRPGLSLPSITHVDGTARVQTVNRHQNSLFHAYLAQMKKLSGHGVSINTSFNRNNEPIVQSPIDAISAFAGSGMDGLIIGNFALTKRS
jgi:carbamoyltransferase